MISLSLKPFVQLSVIGVFVSSINTFSQSIAPTENASETVVPVISPEILPMVDELTKQHKLSDKSKNNITSLVIDAVENFHFRGRELDDVLSVEVFNEYIKSFDPSRLYFLQSDIDEFSQYKMQFDDFLKSAKLDEFYTIHERYVQRLNERLNYALSAISDPQDFNIDENFIVDRESEAWLTDKNIDNEWRKKVKADFLALKLSEKSDEEIRESLTERYNNTLRRSKQLNDIDIFQIIMNAYATRIEPHTSYFSPRISENFQIQMSLSLEGIGAVLQNDNEFTKIRSVVKGGPASLTGQIKSGDIIVGVGQDEDGEMIDVIGWRVDDVVEKIRGPRGTIVRLEIQPKISEDGQTKEVIITRDKINLEEQAAQAKIIERENENNGKIENIGVIELPTFYRDFQAQRQGNKDFRSTTRDVRNLLSELVEKDVKGIIIDLRNNGGGSLDEANALTGLFIESGPIVQVLDSEGNLDINIDPDKKLVYGGPLMVMVNRNSASASEIFAAAIQDYKRGIIIGEPTYGKGTVQQLIDLTRLGRSFLFNSDEQLGQLKLTIAQFFRVNGGTTQYKGVIPDIIFPLGSNDIDYGERSIDNALPWMTIDQVDYQLFDQPINADAIKSVKSKHLVRIEDNPGFDYLRYEFNLIDEIENRKSISLLLSKREEISDARLDERLAKYNNFQSYLGKDTLSKEDFLAEQEDDDFSEEDDDDNAIGKISVDEDIKEDVLLDETSKMLQDYLHING